MFVAGPPTIGAGIIVTRNKKENIRSHNDLLKNQAPLFKPAVEFYRGLSDRAMANCVVVDVFACSLDQVGTLEIRTLVSRTGGLFVLADKFEQSVFRESLRRAFERVPTPEADPNGPPNGECKTCRERLHSAVLCIGVVCFRSTAAVLVSCLRLNSIST